MRRLTATQSPGVLALSIGSFATVQDHARNRGHRGKVRMIGATCNLQEIKFED